MLVLMVAGILVGGFTNTNNLTLLAIRRQPHSLFEPRSKLFGGWTPQRRDFHPAAHPKRIERGASRLKAKARPRGDPFLKDETAAGSRPIQKLDLARL